MNKKCIGIALVFMVIGTVSTFALNATGFSNVLSQAQSKAQKAYTLAKSDVEGNHTQIVTLVKEVTNLLIQAQNYVDEGGEISSAQQQKIDNINADLKAVKLFMEVAGFDF